MSIELEYAAYAVHIHGDPSLGNFCSNLRKDPAIKHFCS
jgi:hypothetical protein